MKTIIILIFSALIFGCVSPTVKPIRLNDRTFCQGTYTKGNDVTEPRPSESKYFRTDIGGFQIIQATAGYMLFLDVITSPSKTIYTRAIIQNPLDENQPFVYDHFIDSSTKNSTISHGPVKGLQIYKKYKIEYIAFEDEARTKEIDRLEQYIRSYVDTTGEELLLYGQIEEKKF